MKPPADLPCEYVHARETHEQSDVRNSERFVELHGEDLLFVAGWKKWCVWDGTRFRADDRGAVLARAKDTTRAMLGEAKAALLAVTEKYSEAAANGEKKATDTIKEAQRAFVWAVKSQDAKRIHSMISLAAADPSIAITVADLDADPWLLNVENGTIDLKSGNLRPHDRADRITKIAACAYDRNARAPVLDKFIARITNGDTERAEFLHRYLGYALTGDVREHVLTFWWGKGGNGKSVLGGLAMRVLGEYAAKAAPSLLLRTEKTDRHPTEIADLFGRRLIVCNETQRGRSWDEATIKDITGGDRITARRMREDFWSFDPSHKIVVFGNLKPRFSGSPDGGIKRRLRLVPFDVQIPKNEIDRALPEKLWAEAPGVLAWFVRGCLAWQAAGLGEAKAVNDATSEYFHAEDHFGQYFAARVVFDQNARITRKALRVDYEAWCEERGEKPAGPRALGDAVRENDATPGKVKDDNKSPREGWKGVRLKTPAELTDDDSPAVAVVTGSGDIPGYPATSRPRDPSYTERGGY